MTHKFLHTFFIAILFGVLALSQALTTRPVAVARQEVVFFGGREADGSTYSRDTWLYSTSDDDDSCEASEDAIYPGDIVDVDLAASGIALYGLQVMATVDPAVLVPQSADFGDFFDDPYLIGANTVDAEAGTWIGALAKIGADAAVTGEGIFATIHYQAVAPGETGFTVAPLFSDQNGFEIGTVDGDGFEVADPNADCREGGITILTFGSISSTVTYQGRLDYATIEVTATGPVTNTAQSSSEGLAEVIELEAGDYQVKADAPSYLPVCAADVAVLNDEATSLPEAQLRGGDVNDDTDDSMVINIGDATRLAANFNQPASADAQADINADGTINIQDLSILGGNYEQSGCQNWPTS